MGKPNPKPSIPNKHLHSRVSFLHQAATYLTLQGGNTTQPGSQSTAEANYIRGELEPSLESPGPTSTRHNGTSASTRPGAKRGQLIHKPETSGLPLYLSSHLFQVARKSQIRLQCDVKHSICKRCNSVLAEGTTCRKFVENLSRGGKKPHADVLVVECGVCGAEKRWPVGAQRQKRKGKRKAVVGGEDEGGRAVEAEKTGGQHLIAESH